MSQSVTRAARIIDAIAADPRTVAELAEAFGLHRSIVYVDKAEDESGVRMYSRIGKAVIPYCSAVGKAILANLDVGGRDAVLAGVTWQRYTDHTITTRDALDRELALVAARGWAVDDREFEPYVNCIAVPIRSPLGVVGAISVTAVRMVADLDRLRTHLPALRETAELISRELG